jgi:electron transport complex protein RnfB
MWESILTATLIVTGIALVAGLLLSFASRQLPADTGTIVEEINALLPQTQCAQCGFPGCRPYAQAIVEDDVAVNLCPPGGQETADRLAATLGRETVPLATTAEAEISIAVINEAQCIGCTHCREACPVDAITGAHQFMHTVIESECTGCELCVAPCPVDCISMVAVT